MAVSLRAEVRKQATKAEIKQLRAEGNVPAVVYGKKTAATILTVNLKDLQAVLRQNPHAIIDLAISGASNQPVMITEIQRNPLNRRELYHIDFHQINMDEPIKTVVALDFTGDAVGAREGGIMQILMHDIEIRCMPSQVPASIQVDVSNLGLGDNLHASQITMPAGIELKSDPNDILVTILVPQKETKAEETEEPAAAEAEMAAEAVPAG